jgi:UDP-galactopyranose mutase
LKQWGKHPRELDPSVCGRIPIRFNEVETYVDHKYQIIPANGYTEMFGNMIKQEGIEVRLGIDYNEVKETIRPSKATLYTGPVDEYFDFRLGKLPWRSLDFQFTEHKKEFFQECVQINYPNDHDYTRSVEIKHVTRQAHPHTVVSHEFPKSVGDPYYPVPAPENRSLYEKYRPLAEAETAQNKVYFAGRLAEYTYINTDEAIEKAFAVFERIRNDCHDR